MCAVAPRLKTTDTILSSQVSIKSFFFFVLPLTTRSIKGFWFYSTARTDCQQDFNKQATTTRMKNRFSGVGAVAHSLFFGSIKGAQPVVERSRRCGLVEELSV